MKADRARHEAREQNKRRKKAKTRRCALTGDVCPANELIRFVLDPENRVVPDIDAKLPGRGIWIRAQAATLDQAICRNVFARAARAPAQIEDGLAELVVMLLRRRCLNFLGLARRAGLAACGFDQVRDQFQRDGARFILTASDAGPHGFEKLERLAGDTPRVSIFSREELSLAFGRPNVVHAALRHGPLSEAFAAELERLRGLQS